MATCAMCGKEIEDGKSYCELCEEASRLQSEDAYLDELLDSVQQDEISGSQENGDMEISLDELEARELETLANEEKTDLSDPQILKDNPELKEQVEGGEDISELLGMLSDHYDGENEDKAGDSIGMDDIFDNALSAISYMENEPHAEPPEDAHDLLAEAENFNLETMEEPFGLTEDAGMAETHTHQEEENALSEAFGESIEQIAVTQGKGKEEEQAQKNSFFQRIRKKYFDNIIDEKTIADEERERQENLPEERAKQLEAKRVKKEEKAKAKEEQQARKKETKSAREEEKRLIREEKAAKKQAQKEEEANAYVGKVNPVGAAVNLILFALVGGGVFFGMKMISYHSSVGDATAYLKAGQYEKAYRAVAGVQVSESDSKVYQKVRLLASMQQQLDACDEYLIMNMPLQALDSLVKGIHIYDGAAEESERLEITDETARLGQKLTDKLYEEFHMTSSEARQILQSATREEYTQKLMQKIA